MRLGRAARRGSASSGWKVLATSRTYAEASRRTRDTPLCASDERGGGIRGARSLPTSTVGEDFGDRMAGVEGQDGVGRLVVRDAKDPRERPPFRAAPGVLVDLEPAAEGGPGLAGEQRPRSHELAVGCVPSRPGPPRAAIPSRPAGWVSPATPTTTGRAHTPATSAASRTSTGSSTGLSHQAQRTARGQFLRATLPGAGRHPVPVIVIATSLGARRLLGTRPGTRPRPPRAPGRTRCAGQVDRRMARRATYTGMGAGCPARRGRGHVPDRRAQRRPGDVGCGGDGDRGP
jgi:hypothetical protein